MGSVGTGAATLASGANYLLVSGLKPKGKIGKRLMVQREHLQERYRKREVLVRERMGVGRERMRARQVGRQNMRLCDHACLLPCGPFGSHAKCTSDPCTVFRGRECTGDRSLWGVLTLLLLRGTVLNRTYGTHKKPKYFDIFS